VLQQQINQIRRFLSNAQTPDSVIAPKHRQNRLKDSGGVLVAVSGQ
jgi:hypothetical protein